jgi:O-antigen/teichoic acid export membrane protein
MVTLAQLADFFYAPTDYVLINRLLDPKLGGIYAPAVQIDAAMLLMVVAMAAVLFPKAAVAHAGGDTARLKQYFLRGTLASSVMLLVAAIAVYFASPLIFPLWLGNPMLATQAILPLLLIHTVIGGSSAVGRSILLGMGKVKPFTIAVLIAGVSNVALSYCFVRFGGMGLNGIVLGTVCAVVGRCAIWQPWYVWRCLSRANDGDSV